MRTDITYFGDCLELMPEVLPDKSVDMILADLPYGTTGCRWDSIIDLAALWDQYTRVIKDRGAILLFAQTPFDKVLGASNLRMLRYEWIWEKTQATGHLNANRMPLKAHENILVFYKKLPPYFPQKTKGHTRKVSKGTNRDATIERAKQKWNGEYIYGEIGSAPNYDSTERFPRSVLVFPSDKQKECLHPTQKPLALIEYLLRTYTKEQDVVLDNVCGSGTTGLAAKRLNRRYVMMENDPEIFLIAKRRVGELSDDTQ